MNDSSNEVEGGGKQTFKFFNFNKDHVYFLNPQTRRSGSKGVMALLHKNDILQKSMVLVYFHISPFKLFLFRE